MDEQEVKENNDTTTSPEGLDDQFPQQTIKRCTLHFPECRRKAEFCRKMLFLPLCAVGLNIISSIIAIGAMGGLSVDNSASASLFGAMIFWTLFTGIFSGLIAVGFKVPCFLGCISFMLMSAFIGYTLIMATSFIGVMVCIVAFYYAKELDDLKGVYGYPHFREDYEFEYLRPTHRAPMQITPKKLEYTPEERLKHLEKMKSLDKRNTFSSISIDTRISEAKREVIAKKISENIVTPNTASPEVEDVAWDENSDR